MPIALSNYLPSGGVFPHIEIANVVPLSAGFQTINDPGANDLMVQMWMNEKVIDTNNLGTFNPATSSLVIPRGRWQYNIRTSIYNSSNYSVHNVGLSSSELNDFITLETGSGSAHQGYTTYFNMIGEFVNNVSYTLSLQTFIVGSLGVNYIGASGTYGPWNGYPYNSNKKHKRASLKLWKLE